MEALSGMFGGIEARLRRVPRAQLYLALYLVALALLLWIGCSSHFRHVPAEMEMDEKEYYGIAGDFLRGDFNISPRRTIGFPLLIAAIRLLSNNFLFLQIVITAIYALSVPLIFRLVKVVGGDHVPAMLASLAFAAWPTGLYFGTSLYSETVALPIFLLALSTLPSAVGPSRSLRKTFLMALAAGLLLGVTAHIRPMYQLFLPFAALVLLIEDGARRIAWLKIVGLFAGFAIVVLPWSALMQARFHQPILLSANGGENLAGGLTPVLFEPVAYKVVDVGGRVTSSGFGRWVSIDQNGYLTPAELKLPYEVQDKLLRKRVTAWILSHPGQAAQLELYKLTYMWGIYPLSLGNPMQVLFGSVPLFVILLATLYFLARLPFSRQRYVRLWILAFFVSAVGLISWGSWRYRQCGDVGLLAYCAICGWHMVQSMRVRTRSVA